MIRLQTCPICSKELKPQDATDSPHFPFCGVRCKQIDLMRWSDGKYAIVDPLFSTPEEVPESSPDDEQ
ncbi:MAG: DNA gyrase inhibitor YacG [Planctomycetaceae bacterium]